MRTENKTSPFQIENIRRFIAFRVFFNARFYYPVFTILFLDFGLSLKQFAILNAVWAATIVVLEVPSGALADTVGRRSLLIFAAILMVLEISLLCFAPRNNPNLLFAVFLINRVCSGAAEAAASGADEALAYDSLKKQGNVAEWDLVLKQQMRAQSIAFIVAMSVGAAVYDAGFMQRIADGLSFKVNITQTMTLRFPLYLTLLMALLAVLTTLRMTELNTFRVDTCTEAEKCVPSIIQAFKLTLLAGDWILKTPFALIIIASGLLFDHIIRLIITLSSQYYRLIQLPESSFGLIGSGLALLGFFIPHIALKLVQKSKPAVNLGIISGLTLIGLVGLTFFMPFWGLLPMILLYVVMLMGGFFVSHYLNRITNSHQRATVLSFKGLSLNFGYGLIGILYSFLLSLLSSNVASPSLFRSQLDFENIIFIKSLIWFPWYFVILLSVLYVFARWQLRNCEEHHCPG